MELEQLAQASDVELELPPPPEEHCKFKAPPQLDDCTIEAPSAIAQQDGVLLELPGTLVQNSRKHARTIVKGPDKSVGSAKVWRLGHRGIESSPEVGKVVCNCVEILEGLVRAGQGQRQKVAVDLAASRSRDLLDELLRRLGGAESGRFLWVHALLVLSAPCPPARRSNTTKLFAECMRTSDEH